MLPLASKWEMFQGRFLCPKWSFDYALAKMSCQDLTTTFAPNSEVSNGEKVVVAVAVGLWTCGNLTCGKGRAPVATAPGGNPAEEGFPLATALIIRFVCRQKDLDQISETGASAVVASVTGHRRAAVAP